MARKRAETNLPPLENSVLNPLEVCQPAVELGKTDPVDIVIRGPIDKQIETRTADGKRRITPKFLLPQNDVGCSAFQTR